MTDEKLEPEKLTYEVEWPDGRTEICEQDKFDLLETLTAGGILTKIMLDGRTIAKCWND